jgi:hypothetical protein
MQAVRKLTSVNRLLADLAGLAVIGRLIKPLTTDVEAREMRIGDSRCPDVVDFGAI